jgi:hypothetical protein
MALYHFSESAAIEVFEPRHPPARTPGSYSTLSDDERVVWAIDAWHAPLYYFPRDCPRIVLWPLEGTTAADRERWFGADPAAAAAWVAHIEWAWLERMRETTIYRYTLPEEPFEYLGDPGTYLSRVAVRPLAMEPVGDLMAALAGADVELRLAPSLLPLRGVWDTTLHASGIRLRNAVGWQAMRDAERNEVLNAERRGGNDG